MSGRFLHTLLISFAILFPAFADAGVRQGTPVQEKLPLPHDNILGEVRQGEFPLYGERADSVLTAKVKESLGRGLEEYFSALERESVEVKSKECDFIIGACQVDEVRQFTALKVYDHYLNSPVMGDEAVAIHVYDNWFANGKVAMVSDVDMLNAAVFADFNRHSLIGMRAPELTLFSPDGSPATIFPSDTSFSPVESSRYRLLYFYDTDCVRCRIETPRLHSALVSNDWPLDVYAVYVGSDEAGWADIRATFDEGLAPGVRVRHFDDSSFESDFQRLYGVLQTPKMFLVRPDGIIIGRNLDVPSLGKLMEAELRPKEYEYGGEVSSVLFDRLLPGEKLSRKDILDVATDISTVTLQRGDTLEYKHLEGDLLYWLSNRRGEDVKQAQKEFIDTYILGSGLYTTKSDSLSVVSLAQMMSGLLSLSPTGSRIFGITVPGRLLSSKGAREGRFTLDRLKGRPSYILFHSERCSSCATELAAADSLSRLPSMKKAKILLVDVDDILANRPELGRTLLQNFDLSSTPLLIETDRKGIIKRKYFSFRDL